MQAYGLLSIPNVPYPHASALHSTDHNFKLSTVNFFSGSAPVHIHIHTDTHTHIHTHTQIHAITDRRINRYKDTHGQTQSYTDTQVGQKLCSSTSTTYGELRLTGTFAKWDIR